MACVSSAGLRVLPEPPAALKLLAPPVAAVGLEAKGTHRVSAQALAVCPGSGTFVHSWQPEG